MASIKTAGYPSFGVYKACAHILIHLLKYMILYLNIYLNVSVFPPSNACPTLRTKINIYLLVCRILAHAGVAELGQMRRLQGSFPLVDARVQISSPASNSINPILFRELLVFTGISPITVINSSTKSILPLSGNYSARNHPVIAPIIHAIANIWNGVVDFFNHL